MQSSHTLIVFVSVADAGLERGAVDPGHGEGVGLRRTPGLALVFAQFILALEVWPSGDALRETVLLRALAHVLCAQRVT